MRRAVALTLGLAATLAAERGVAGSRLAYLAGNGTDAITVIDVDAQVLVDTFHLDDGGSPVDVVVSSDRQYLYVTRIDGTIEKRSRADGSLATATDVGLQAQELLFSADGGRLYIAGFDAMLPAVIVCDPDTLAVLTSVTLPGTGFGLALSPDGDRLYVSSPADDSISVIDTATDTLLDTIAVGNAPQGVAVAADGARVYVGGYSPNGVAALFVIDAASGQAIDGIEFGIAPLTLPFFIALSPSRAYITVAHVSPEPWEALGIVDLATATPLPGADLGTAQATAIELLPDGRLLVVAGGVDTRLLIYDSASLAPLGAVTVPSSMRVRGMAVVDIDPVFADGFDG